jgi:AcrR family transcriptional regulator
VSRAEAIREAAVDLFFDRGYHGTSMRDIANALDIRAPSLYNHVASKQAMLQDIMFQDIELVQREFDAATGSAPDAREKVRRGAEAHVRHHVLRAREAKINHNEIAALEEPAQRELKRKRRAYGQAWVELIEEAIAEGVATCPSPKLAAFAILDMGIGVARWFRPEGLYSANTLPVYYGDFALALLHASPSEIEAARGLGAQRLAGEEASDGADAKPEADPSAAALKAGGGQQDWH